MLAWIIVLGLCAICFGVLILIAVVCDKCSDNSMGGRMAARTSRQIEQVLFVYLTGIILFIGSFFLLPFLSGICIGLQSSGYFQV